MHDTQFLYIRSNTYTHKYVSAVITEPLSGMPIHRYHHWLWWFGNQNRSV